MTMIPMDHALICSCVGVNLMQDEHLGRHGRQIFGKGSTVPVIAVEAHGLATLNLPANNFIHSSPDIRSSFARHESLGLRIL